MLPIRVVALLGLVFFSVPQPIEATPPELDRAVGTRVEDRGSDEKGQVDPQASKLAAAALREGAAALQEGRLEQAEAAFGRAAHRQPESPLPWLGLSQVVEQRGQTLDALVQARRAQENAPGDGRALARIAELQVKLGAAGEALDTLERWRRVEPDEPRAYVLAALVSRDVGRPEAAVQLLREARTKTLPNVDVDRELGLLLLATGDPAAAEKLATRATELYPDDGGLALVLGLAVVGDPKRRDEAVAWLEKALQLGAPNPGRVHLELGTALAQNGCEPRALEHFRTAVQLLPEQAEAHYRLGAALRACGDSEGARASLERFRALGQRDDSTDHGQRSTGAALNDVRRLADEGKLDQALKALGELAAATPVGEDPDSRLYLLQAKLLFSAGQREEALISAIQARELMPSRVEAHYLEGLFASQLGQLDAAAEALRRALAIDAGESGSHALLAAILADRGELEASARHFEKALLYGAEGPALRLAYSKVLERLGRDEESLRQQQLYRQLVED